MRIDGVDFTSARLKMSPLIGFECREQHVLSLLTPTRFPKFQQVEFGQAGTDFLGNSAKRTIFG